MSEHTELPWFVSSSTLIITPGAEIIANTTPFDVPGLNLSLKEAKANAEYIVRACNAFQDIEEGISLIAEKNHYHQLEAQAKSQPALLAACKAMEKLFFMCGSGIYAAGGVIDAINSAKTQAKAAIAAATEGDL